MLLGGEGAGNSVMDQHPILRGKGKIYAYSLYATETGKQYDCMGLWRDADFSGHKPH